MAKLLVDLKASHALQRIESDPDAAAEALLLVAKYLRAREELPDDLVDWFAGAIEASMAKRTKKEKEQALLHELGFRQLNRRKKDSWIRVGRRFEELLYEEELNQNQAASAIAVEFGIDESTAKRYWRDYRKAIVYEEDT